MKFTVVWRTTANSRLAELWMAAPDRNAVTSAANKIDSQLARDPMAIGEGRNGDNRIAIEPPLVVYYEVNTDDCLVTVWDVWRSDGK